MAVKFDTIRHTYRGEIEVAPQFWNRWLSVEHVDHILIHENERGDIEVLFKRGGVDGETT